ARLLSEVIRGADIFLGLSAGKVLRPEMVKDMATNPLIFALANPIPEIFPEAALQVRPDAILATGRTDYPNQVNNVLCFPFIFRGALDVGAITINREMEIAAVNALAELAQQEQSDVVANAYGSINNPLFGSQYLIPKPFDPRLIAKIAPAVVRAAIDSGVATRQISDIDLYTQHLQQFVYHSSAAMKPIFSLARRASTEKKRILFAEGEEERVLRAVQIIVDENLAMPILIGLPSSINKQIQRCGLRLTPGFDFEIVNPDNNDKNYRKLLYEYEQIDCNVASNLPTDIEKSYRSTIIGAILLKIGEADGMICGTINMTHYHLQFIDQVIGKKEGCSVYAAMNSLVLPKRQIFLVDTHVNIDPTPEELAEITVMAARAVRNFDIEPSIALLSHSNFGTSNAPSAKKMRDTLMILRDRFPDLKVDGEMHGDVALDSRLRKGALQKLMLKDDANLLVFPNIDAANIAYNLLKTASGNNIAIGPILLGPAKPVHVLTESATVRRIVNISALLISDLLG
ncbi:MAG: phosphate acyltransferase, partial [Burkholderia sp.]|nr:phosphate acyltransferase [Burkholderia sp.]